MVMETDQEVIIGLSSFKGKRTKRQRPASPIGLPATYSAGESGTATGDSRITSSSFGSNNNNNNLGGEEEEEDMANCLILLARGSREINRGNSPVAVRPRTAAADGGDYRCKTCDRSFPSFQALGGHRASHKKPNNKFGKEENTIKLPEKLLEEFDHRNRKFIDNPMSTNLSLQISNNINYFSKENNSKIHECSICGAEFSSGQALGGHMRRHRTVFSSTAGAITDLPSTTAPSGANSGRNNPPEFRESKKPRSSLQLDLNLPAESEEDTLDGESELRFQSKEQVLAFSANSLVDCHY